MSIHDSRKAGLAGGRQDVWARFTGVVLLTVSALACDFSVTNPGPVQDKFLNDPKAFDAIVTGMEYAYSKAIGVDGYGDFAKITGCVAREIFPSGNTLDHGCGTFEEVGHLRPEEEDIPWAGGHNARWLAEDGIRRMTEVLGAEADSNPYVARGYMWAGLANRLLGEYMCQAVIDGGAPEDASVHLTRAEEQLTKAIAIAQAAGLNDVKTEALASRAALRVDLGDWTGAVADAVQVPENFSFQAQFFEISVETYNVFNWAVAGAPFRALSVWNTPYEQYYQDTHDPRTPWTTDPAHPFGNLARACCGQVPFLIQTKYLKTTSPIDINDGREMLLVRAEAMLRDHDVAGAMALVNHLRTTVGVDPWPDPASEDEAWTYLKRERGIELWLEGRRLNDLKRWAATNTPGDIWPLEDANNPATYLEPDRAMCFPIPLTETRTNPNT